MKHATFHLGYIWAALAMALGAGLPIGVHLTFILGFGFPVGAGFASLMQTHGHLQLRGGRASSSWASVCISCPAWPGSRSRRRSGSGVFWDA